MIAKIAEVGDDLDFDELARDFVMSGGYIKNAVLRAAYSAAAANKAISQHHLRRAAKVEYEAMGRIMSSSFKIGESDQPSPFSAWHAIGERLH